MMVKALDIPMKDISTAGIPEDTPNWLKPYLAAALRSGLTDGLPATDSGSFGAEETITGAEAAVMLQNALDLSISQETLEALETAATEEETVPAWAQISLTAMAENDIALTANDCLTRSDMANLMYQVSHLAPNAPGMAVLKRQ